MKRLLIPLVTIAFLAFTAVAVADQSGWYMSSKAGSSYGGAAVTGSCKVGKVALTKSARVVCGLSGGTAVLRYGFAALPAGCGPGVSPSVDATGTNVGVTAAKLANGNIRVSLHVTGAGALAVISRVSISYYC